MNWCDIINIGSDSMTYNKLLEILLSDDVYDLFKQNEKEIFEIIPELKICKGFEQNSKWHIYDVYEHILHVVSNGENNIYLRLSALFHDIGKIGTKKGNIENTGLVVVTDETGDKGKR